MKALKVHKLLFNVPQEYIWVNALKQGSIVEVVPVKSSFQVEEKPPVIIGHHVSARFSRHFNRQVNELFTLIIPKGLVFGNSCNYVFTPDRRLVADVSREFGAEGGKKVEDFDFFKETVSLPKPIYQKGTVAVIATAGEENFHHWIYDMIPRLQILKDAGLFDSADYLIMNYKGLSFQKESLKLMGIDESKIINTHGKQLFYLQAEKLLVPSLTQPLGTINPYVLDFLRNTFLSGKFTVKQKLYITRGNAKTRRFENEKEAMQEIFSRGYIEFVPEKYSLAEAAMHFASASSIVSIHGSGLSNLVFISDGTKVLDIMAPYHQDPYYWLICNQRSSTYVGLFAEGEHPADDYDLVKQKVDNNLYVDINKLKNALDYLQ